jgi:hypothetical protein
MERVGQVVGRGDIGDLNSLRGLIPTVKPETY